MKKKVNLNDWQIVVILEGLDNVNANKEDLDKLKLLLNNASVITVTTIME